LPCIGEHTHAFADATCDGWIQNGAVLLSH
jgi:hypothetical protein